MCGGSSRCSFRRSFLALSLSVAATFSAFGQTPPTSPPLSYEWPTLSPEPTTPHDELMRRWSEYDQQFGSLVTSLELFLDRLEAYGISFEQLPTYIEFLENSWKDSEAARLEEREAARQAIQAALDRAARAERAAVWWRRGTVAAAVLGVAGWAAFGAVLLIN